MPTARDSKPRSSTAHFVWLYAFWSSARSWQLLCDGRGAAYFEIPITPPRQILKTRLDSLRSCPNVPEIPETRPETVAERRFAEQAEALSELGLEERFARIYQTNLWFDAESRSGAGSSLDSTAQLRDALPPVLRRLKADGCSMSPAATSTG